MIRARKDFLIHRIGILEEKVKQSESVNASLKEEIDRLKQLLKTKSEKK